MVPGATVELVKRFGIEDEAVILANVLRVERRGEIRFTGKFEQVGGIQFFDVILRK